jgi:hypothetical protein
LGRYPKEFMEEGMNAIYFKSSISDFYTVYFIGFRHGCLWFSDGLWDFAQNLPKSIELKSCSIVHHQFLLWMVTGNLLNILYSIQIFKQIVILSHWYLLNNFSASTPARCCIKYKQYSIRYKSNEQTQNVELPHVEFIV